MLRRLRRRGCRGRPAPLLDLTDGFSRFLFATGLPADTSSTLASAAMPRWRPISRRFCKRKGFPFGSPAACSTFRISCDRKMFDGRVFRGGNAACFLEPLEATAIGTAIVQVRSAAAGSRSMVGANARTPTRSRLQQGDAFVCVPRFALHRMALCMRLSMGYSVLAIRPARHRTRPQEPLARAHLADMEEFVEAGRALPGRALAAYDDQERWDREVYPLLRLYRPFGQLLRTQLRQIGHGIGYYDANLGSDRRQRSEEHRTFDKPVHRRCRDLLPR